MPQTKWLCFRWKPQEEVTDNEMSEEEESDDEGYGRLDSSEDSYEKHADKYIYESKSKNVGQAEKPETEDQKLKENSPYVKRDKKAKKLSRKLRRKEKRAQFIHLVHVTWKWCKRGFLATAPRLSATFNLAPSPGPMVYNIQRTTPGGKTIYSNYC
ncbi:hypothetical protein EGW08_013746 [Elysia chlorotica]|uniref:Uncharacterized protein n=1 Tax=Elysia chlorotica TaxID=188477 RepID=A0A3S0ZML6_ELYCH|nr:hypothetical protein EGW08_013746 [Elysia chlorotica]